MHRVIFIDTEVNPEENRVQDYGAAGPHLALWRQLQSPAVSVDTGGI